MTIGDAITKAPGYVVTMKRRHGHLAVVMDKEVTHTDGETYVSLLCNDGWQAEWLGYKDVVIAPIQSQAFIAGVKAGSVWQEWAYRNPERAKKVELCR